MRLVEVAKNVYAVYVRDPSDPQEREYYIGAFSPTVSMPNGWHDADIPKRNDDGSYDRQGLP